MVTPEPKLSSHVTNNHQRIENLPSHLANPSPICQPNVRSSKIVRILTVLAYMVAVSMAAILLSIYYTFIWNPYANMVPNSMDSINGSNDSESSWSLEPHSDGDIHYQQIERFLPLPYSVWTNTSPKTRPILRQEPTTAKDQSLHQSEVHIFVSSSTSPPVESPEKGSSGEAMSVTKFILSSAVSSFNHSSAEAALAKAQFAGWDGNKTQSHRHNQPNLLTRKLTSSSEVFR